MYVFHLTSITENSTSLYTIVVICQPYAPMLVVCVCVCVCLFPHHKLGIHVQCVCARIDVCTHALSTRNIQEDTKDMRTYYHNPSLKLSQWEKPEALAWTKKDSKRYFWYNSVSKESSWDTPRDAKFESEEHPGRFYYQVDGMSMKLQYTQ